MNFELKNFTQKIICENECTDSVIDTVVDGGRLDLYITAKEDKVKFIELEWKFTSDDNIFVLGDAWERSYGDLGFLKLRDNDRYMPWYFIATDTEKCMCFGVKTGINSFVNFRYTKEGIYALIDCRNGGSGVHLEGRKLHAATFILENYDSSDVFGCLNNYCRTLCDNPILPKEIIYGGNNWYYAYGKSSYDEIISDTKLQVELSEGIKNRPFQVIDDCWQINSCAGPWLPNEKFGDMKKLADEIREMGARPGIWVRLLRNLDSSITDDIKIQRNDGKEKYLDPTHPAVQDIIRADIERIKGWGYELLKHDFTTADLFGSFGGADNGTITKYDNWHFYDKTKTNAEITLDLYRLIKETAGEMLVLGCNTISHLCAGYVEINRIGDDTSGREWNRTTKMGVNTLAFRLAQNENFYMCDADCVGILGDNIPWEKNSQWLHLLSHSNTPLFVASPYEISDDKKKDIAEAYRVFHQRHTIKPVDIFENKTPSVWEIDGKEIKYNW